MNRAGFLTGFWTGAGLALAVSAASGQDLPDLSQRAAALIAAGTALEDAALSTPDRVAAVTMAIARYEAAQASLRAGLRDNVLAQAVLEARIAAGVEQRAALVAALVRLAPLAGGGAVLHPDGPVATARAGMLMADLVPQLDRQAETLGTEAQALSEMTDRQESALAALADGLDRLQTARITAVAAAARAAGPGTTDRAVLEALARDAATLESLAASLPRASAAEQSPPQAAPLPVRGTVLRGYGEADAAGVARPGWVLSTEPGALVQAPFGASVLYAGPVQGPGQVIVLEPAAEHLLILAGLGDLLVVSGAVVSAGAGLGFSGSASAGSHTNAIAETERTGTHRTDTLYMEARTRDGPVDPAGWFARQED